MAYETKLDQKHDTYFVNKTRPPYCMYEENSCKEFPDSSTYLMAEDLLLPVARSRIDLAADPDNVTSLKIVYLSRGLVLFLHDRLYGG